MTLILTGCPTLVLIIDEANVSKYLKAYLCVYVFVCLCTCKFVCDDIYFLFISKNPFELFYHFSTVKVFFPLLHLFAKSLKVKWAKMSPLTENRSALPLLQEMIWIFDLSLSFMSLFWNNIGNLESFNNQQII